MLTQPDYTDSLNYYLSLLTLIGLAVVVVWILLLLVQHFAKKDIRLLRIINSYALPTGFLISAVATFLSLFYEFGIYYAPCELCWIQRIFLYPLTVLFAVAWWKKDTAVTLYTGWLSLLGLLAATYHHFLQIGFDLYKPCSTALFAADCAKPSFIEFGFVSFPFMAIVTFSFLLLISVNGWVCKQK